MDLVLFLSEKDKSVGENVSEPERGPSSKMCGVQIVSSVSALRRGSDKEEEFSIEGYFKFIVTAVNTQVSGDVSPAALLASPIVTD